MKQNISKSILSLVFLLFSLGSATSQNTSSILAGRVICIDPGHGGTAATDSYRVGPGGEREEWINLRVGLALKKLLEQKGAKVLITRTTDQFVALPERAKMAMQGKAELFVSIHHNATADSSVNFPIIYFHGNQSENKGSVAFGKMLAKRLLKNMHRPQSPVSLVSDFTIFPELGAAVLRNTYGIPAVLAEASFFTHANEEQRLKQEEYNILEAKAYLEAMESFFAQPAPAILTKNSVRPAIPPFKVFQEAERMTPVAKQWKQDFEAAGKLMSKNDTASLRQAYSLYTRSAKSFPDSYVAARCHQKRAAILALLKKPEEAAQEEQRAKEFYVTM